MIKPIENNSVKIKRKRAVLFKTLFKSEPSNENICLIKLNAMGNEKTVMMRDNSFSWYHHICIGNKNGMSINREYCNLENIFPKRTAKVFLPEILSVSASLKLFTTKIAFESIPMMTPIHIDKELTSPS